MGTILIGNIKGPQGSQGIQGPQGPAGPAGPTGPGADIYNGLDQTEAGVAGLDAYQGRVLDQKKVDAAVTTGYGVLNETYIDTGGYNKLWYRRQGAVVVVNISLLMKETVSDNTTALASGLPEARANEDYPVMDTTQQKAKILGINGSGEIVINWGTLNAGDRIRGTLVYIAR